MNRKPGGPRWESPDPAGVTGTYGTAAVAWAKRELGITLGKWQAYVVRRALRHDKDGNLIHRVVLLSTARQNGKSVVVRTIFGWMLDEGRRLPAFSSWRTMLAAAHDAKQARIVYTGVYNDLSGIDRIREASKGKRYDKDAKLTEHFGIRLGELMLDTVTSQPGSSRGLSAGAVARDELNTQRDWDMWEALAPTQSAQRNPLMILTSTAGFSDSVVLRSFYDRLVRQASGDEAPEASFYGAWWQSDDKGAGLDWRQVKQANPALDDGRLSRDFIRTTEWGILPPDSWQRERLNHFVDVAVGGAFAPKVWDRCRLPDALEGVEPPYILGVDIQPGWERATIAVAAVRPDGRMGVEVYRDLRAADVGRITGAMIVDIIRAFPQPVSTVVYDSVSGGAPSFERAGAEAWGVEWRALKPAQVVSACMDITEMIQSGRLAVDDPLLDAQIVLTARRNVGQEGAFRFTRQDSGGPIDGIMAMTFAVHVAANLPAPPNII